MKIKLIALATFKWAIDQQVKRKVPYIYFSKGRVRQIFSILLVDPDRETMALPRKVTLCLRGGLKEGLCAPKRS